MLFADFDINQLLSGNTPIWIVIVFLVVMQLFPDLFKKKPTPTPTPVDPNTPPVVVTPPVITVPADHPILDQLIQLLVQYGPVLLPIILKQQAEKAAKEAEGK